jgi:DNA polymerase III subunit gamma/tau
MDNFIVSARKYRPSTFDTVVGQNPITSTLKNAIRNNILAQAFLFCGPRGVGKTTCARILAKTINCFNPTPEIEACDQCESCVSFNQSASFNIHELDAASNNSVEDIRNLVDQVRIPPQVGRFKVYIIDEVHMLSQAAFNAFLKTLEEPPSYAKFILATTEKHKIIPTILSRCQIFDFKRITVEDISSHLSYVAQKENVNTESEALNIIAQKADGALRDALSIFDQMVSFSGNSISYQDVITNLNVLDYDYYFRVVDDMLQGNTSATLLILHEIINNGFDGQHFITGLGSHLRNLLVAKEPQTIELMDVSESLRERYTKQSGKCQPGFLLKSLEILNQCDIHYKSSNHKRLHLEIALLNICQLSTRPLATSDSASADQAQKTQSAYKHHDRPASVVSEKPLPQAPGQHPQPSGAQIKSDENKPLVREIPPPVKKVFSSSITEIQKQQHSGQEETAAAVLNNPFSQEQLKQAWIGFTNEYKNTSPGFTVALSRYEPKLLDNQLITLTFDNAVLAADRLNMNAFTEYLKKTLNNTLIRIQTDVIEKPKEIEAYTDKEKFEKLSAARPELNQLKSQLGLETEF